MNFYQVDHLLSFGGQTAAALYRVTYKGFVAAGQRPVEIDADESALFQTLEGKARLLRCLPIYVGAYRIRRCDAAHHRQERYLRQKLQNCHLFRR